MSKNVINNKLSVTIAGTSEVISNIYELEKIGAGHDGYVYRFNGRALKILKYDIKLRKEKSEKAKKAAMQRWQDNSTDADALLPQCECKAIKESKVNESKEKEINYTVNCSTNIPKCKSFFTSNFISQDTK